VLQLLSPALQRQLVVGFSQAIAAAYPASVVHAKQVRDALKGSHQFQDSDNQNCGDGFTVPVRHAYAAVLGITRASWYRVERDGGRVELLVPVTLNLQLVKPDSAKVVYAVSETLYSPFSFTKEEMGTEKMQAAVADVLARGLQQQVAALVAGLKTGFQPKEAPVRIVGRSQRVLVADQGFEIGFKAGDEPLAVNRKTGKEALFKVLSVDSGYAVLRTIDGEAAPGDEFSFVFESPADDSRKPRPLPLASTAPERQWTGPVAELFAKDIGFKARFQVAPVDPNFQNTMATIAAQANCVPWDKYPSAKPVFDSRTDAPDYFVRFEMSRSPVALQSGLGAVKTVESFATAVTAQLVDAGGNVLFSELGHDVYRLEKTDGQGLSLPSAYEVSMKNATSRLAAQFAQRVQFEPGEFKISSADAMRFTVAGLALREGQTAPAYEVLRPLDVQVNGKPTFWRLDLGAGREPPATSGSGTSFSYSKLDEAPQPGDIVRVRDMPRNGQTRIAECRDPFRGTGSLAADELLPLVRHAAYRSTRYQISLASDGFTSDANRLLEAGFFKLRVPPVLATEPCIKAGYAVRPEAGKCDAGLCSAQILAAATLILDKAGERLANTVQAEKVSFDGFAEAQRDSFIGFKAHESVLKSLPRLIDKFTNPNTK